MEEKEIKDEYSKVDGVPVGFVYQDYSDLNATRAKLGVLYGLKFKFNKDIDEEIETLDLVIRTQEKILEESERRYKEVSHNYLYHKKNI